jgi:hypothetical protein
LLANALDCPKAQSSACGMNTELPLYVLVTYHSSLKGAFPIPGIVKRLGGLLKASTINKDTHTQVFLFDQSIYGRTFMKVIERADIGIIATALNSTDY